MVDLACGTQDIAQLHAELCGSLAGRVVEIGFGSGLNTPYYPTSVVSVDAVEPSDLGWRLSSERRTGAAVPINRIGLDGQRLDADDSTYHSALSTFTLCTIPDVAAALREVRRVLRPGGSLHLLEHGLAATPRVVRWQHRLEPLQKRVAGGCHLTRDMRALVTDAGLEICDLRTEYLPGPAPSRPWTYLYLGRAIAV